MATSTWSANTRKDVAHIETKLKEHDLFAKLTPEKLEELADAIYMAALRADLSVSTAIDAIRSSTALRPQFFEAEGGCVFSFIKPAYREFAKRIFLKRAGGGTPNAAMGKGELLLMLLSGKTEKPVRGDILYETREIEIKANGGKVGLANGREVNKAVVTYCSRHRIALRNAQRGKAAKDQPMFDPTKKEDREALGEKLPEVLSEWWRAISGESIKNPTWPEVRQAYLRQIAAEQFHTANSEILVINGEGLFRFFRTKSDFVTYYNRNSTRYEYRGYQTNPISIYLDVWSEDQTKKQIRKSVRTTSKGRKA
ncbi:MAG: hypothetical protein FJ247_12890 [Nitrospira sp.]|nr:hypothetical protein [Nitrospira sp.]